MKTTSPQLNLDKFIGLALRLIREYNRYKQCALADELNISRTYLCEVEAGQKRISYEFMMRYEKVFGITLYDIFYLAFCIAHFNGAHVFLNHSNDQVRKIREWYQRRPRV